MATVEDMRKVADVTAHAKNMEALTVIERDLKAARQSIRNSVSYTGGTEKIARLLDEAMKECVDERGREHTALNKAYAKVREMI